MSSKKRLPWIDYAKGIAIILVVYRHVIMGIEGSGLYDGGILKNLNEAVYSFRMPLFFILSGIFVRRSLKKRGVFGFAKYKFNTLLYTYFIWAFISISLQLIFSNYVNSNRGPIYYLYILILPGAVEPFWFLHTLFTTAILFIILEKYIKPSNNFLLIISFILYLCSGLISENWLGIKDICFYFLFYIIGILFQDFTSEGKYKDILFHKSTLWGLLPLFIINQLYWFYHSGYDDLNRFSDIESIWDKIVFIEIAVVGSFFLMSVSFFLSKSDNLKVLRIIGNHSLYIYIMHIMISSLVRTICIRFFNIDDALLLLIIGITIATFLPILVYKLTNKMGLWFLYSLENPSVKTSVQPEITPKFS
ncbi:acyltransferase family protein [Chondrinema litorale]|uniref:acyltransferase family protein n=1 Tax=Chondrinema litorale TaxID=2994555 RepID=UPI0025435912|nr:acyltransferase [Chondrinema litorale]UZS00130.1 acyltransferase [Chondrinema litorale]